MRVRHHAEMSTFSGHNFLDSVGCQYLGNESCRVHISAAIQLHRRVAAGLLGRDMNGAERLSLQHVPICELQKQVDLP